MKGVHSQQTAPLLQVEATDGSCALCRSASHQILLCPDLQLAVEAVRSRKSKKSNSVSHSRHGSANSVLGAVKKKITIKKEVSIPFFLMYYPLITLAISLTITIPMTYYKWDIAYADEEALAKQSFAGTAVNMIQTLHSSWQYASIGSIVMADVITGMEGNITERLYQRMSDSEGYFGLLGNNSVVGIYEYITLEERAKTEMMMFKDYGSNFGSHTTFNFWEKFPNGTKRIAPERPFYFVLTYVSNDKSPLVNKSLGFNGYSETVARKPLFDIMFNTSTIAVTVRTQLSYLSYPMSGIIFFAPIYFDPWNKSLTRTFTGRENFRYVSISSVDCNLIVQTALSGLLIPDKFHVFLFDQRK
ncbi:hypothetical protein BC830DRAFT_135954 [Chytriomyces sp. MP71]|nr:hypothetical protein BC830DRAFT_135954 [Chytriomyces sp. MP71]